MDEKWVEETIKAKRKHIMLSILEHVQDWDYGEAAEAIAQAHEEERREDIELIGRFANRITEYEAQVAVMTKALKACEAVELKNFSERFGSDEDTKCALCGEPTWKGHLEDCWIEQALSATPKVFCLKGRTSLHYDIEVMAEGAPEEFRRLLIARGMFAAWDVIVCPPKGEQPEESEQEEVQ